MDCGVNFFDTADVYGMGRSEELLAQALGNQRQSVVIATKFGIRREHGRTFRDTSPNGCKSHFAPVCADFASSASTCTTSIGLTRACPWKIRWACCSACEKAERSAIGLSNFTASEVLDAIHNAPISAVQSQFSLIDQHIARPLLDGLAEQRLPLITWGSLAQGLLSGKYDQSISFTTGDRRLRYPNFQPPKLAANLRVVDRSAPRVGTDSAALPATAPFAGCFKRPALEPCCAVRSFRNRPRKMLPQEICRRCRTMWRSDWNLRPNQQYFVSARQQPNT